MLRLFSTVTGLAVATSVASAAFVGVQLRSDPAWSSAATAAINDGAQYKVMRMFAIFNDASDTVISVGQLSTSSDMHLANGATSFFQAPGGTNTSPNSGLFGPIPSVQWDTYISVGRLTSDLGDTTAIDGDFAFADVLPGAGQDTIKGGWFNSNPSNLQGRVTNNAGTLETFLGQFTIKNLASASAASNIGTSVMNTAFNGELTIYQGLTGGGVNQYTVSFVAVPAPSTAALLGAVGLMSARRRRRA